MVSYGIKNCETATLSNPILDVFPELAENWLGDLPVIDNYLDLLTQDTPMIDLRAPCEFDEGAYPFAKSLPLMDNKQRELIGTCYKQQGQKEAIKLGNDLVSGKQKQQRIDAWKTFVKQNPNAVMYCFRGGMRSQISQMWLHENGIQINRVKGGYKALRRFLIDSLAQQTDRQNFITLSGLTGIGKTHFIHEYKKHLDLEGLANHKGSSFGHEMTPQPKPIAFENSLSIDMLKKRHLQGSYIVEDEGNRVGILSIPQPLVGKLKASPIVLLHETLEYRVNNIFQDYVEGIRKSANDTLGKQDGELHFATYVFDAQERIKKRLGPERFQSLQGKLTKAIKHNDENDWHSWIEELMVGYYDPMYQYQLSQKRERVIFEGNRPEIRNFLKDKVT